MLPEIDYELNNDCYFDFIIIDHTDERNTTHSLD